MTHWRSLEVWVWCLEYFGIEKPSRWKKWAEAAAARFLSIRAASLWSIWISCPDLSNQWPNDPSYLGKRVADSDPGFRISVCLEFWAFWLVAEQPSLHISLSNWQLSAISSKCMLAVQAQKFDGMKNKHQVLHARTITGLGFWKSPTSFCGQGHYLGILWSAHLYNCLLDSASRQLCPARLRPGDGTGRCGTMFCAFIGHPWNEGQPWDACSIDDQNAPGWWHYTKVYCLNKWPDAPVHL